MEGQLLSNIELTNFRAFKNETFNLSRLNIFVGPNNSGKSSALSALNLLAQSLQVDNIGGGPLILNGPFDRLGTFKDLVNGGRLSTPIKISFALENFNYEFELKYRSQRREIELTKFKVSDEGKSIYEYFTTKDKYELIILGRKIEDIGHGLRKSRPRFSGFLPIFMEAYSYRFGNRHVNSRQDIDDDVSKFLREAERRMLQFSRLAQGTFRNYDTLGAFREMPQRTYLASGETASRVGRFGENTITILASDASKRGSEQLGLLDEISEWLQDAKIANGIKLKYLTERHYELVVTGKDGQDHNICDVGFGCSQVLPVLVAGIELKHRAKKSTGARGEAILVVQEPEIHLHPNAQADLGTFFASIINTESQIFIETHSDNLVLRVAAHVARGEIKADDVRVFYVNDIDGKKEVTTIRITDEGAFSPEWPGGFFPQRQAESLALARAAMKKRMSEQEPKGGISNKEARK